MPEVWTYFCELPGKKVEKVTVDRSSKERANRKERKVKVKVRFWKERKTE